MTNYPKNTLLRICLGQCYLAFYPEKWMEYRKLYTYAVGSTIPSGFIILDFAMIVMHSYYISIFYVLRYSLFQAGLIRSRTCVNWINVLNPFARSVNPELFLTFKYNRIKSLVCSDFLSLYIRCVEFSELNISDTAWENCLKMVYLKQNQRGFNNEHWPLPEPYWPTAETYSLVSYLLIL